MRYLFWLALFFSCSAQKTYPPSYNPSCNFKDLSSLMEKVEAKHKKEDLDKLFNSIGEIAETHNKGDSLMVLYRYRFCDSGNKTIFFANFFGGKLRYVSKHFSNGTCYGDKKNCMFSLNKTWTYEQMCEHIGAKGDLSAIYWDADGKETQRSYEWKCCNSNERTSVVFADGKYKSSSHFPENDIMGPMNGKPYSHPSGRR
jgi:hypothetical protein